MSSSSRKSRLRATSILEALDLGLPVKAGGFEYVMIDKIYQRTPVYDRDNKVSGYRVFGHEHIGSLTVLVGHMTEEDRFDLSATRALNGEKIDRRHSTFQMLADARAHMISLQGEKLVCTELLDGHEWVERKACISIGSQISYAPDNNIAEIGKTVDGFAVLVDCYINASSKEGRHHVQIGYCDRYNGFVPDEDLKPAPARQRDETPAPGF